MSLLNFISRNISGDTCIQYIKMNYNPYVLVFYIYVTTSKCKCKCMLKQSFLYRPKKIILFKYYCFLLSGLRCILPYFISFAWLASGHQMQSLLYIQKSVVLYEISRYTCTSSTTVTRDLDDNLKILIGFPRVNESIEG